MRKVLSPAAIRDFQNLVLRVPVADPIVLLAVRIARMTRPADESALAEVREFVSYGAGPRATQHLMLAAKARAILDGRPAVDGADILALAHPVLRHRVLTNFHAEAQRISADDIINRVVEAVGRHS